MKAIALYSGGLDSTLAIALLERLGVDVQPIIFTSPFGDRHGQAGWQKKTEHVRQEFDKELLSVPFDDDLIQLVKQPHFGWGKHLNPCIDCHLAMLRRSKDLMSDLNADFVITGEVLGQRPMSQNKAALELIDKKCGLEGLLVRPLSAKHLAPTKPETEGWLDREQLLDFQGRSRKPQLTLAKQWGLTRFGSPAGGCLLTDESFTKKVRDLLASDMLSADNVWWIQPGRYFNLGEQCKLMVARNKDECARLEALAKPDDILLQPHQVAGPTAVMRGKEKSDYLQIAVDIVGYYSKTPLTCDIVITNKKRQQNKIIISRAISENDVRHLLVH
jgi:tRNA-specific 2-thiouridylase